MRPTRSDERAKGCEVRSHQGPVAHEAVNRAQDHIRASFGPGVDVDLEKFFDRVNHDTVMAPVAKPVPDSKKCRSD